MKTGDCPYHRKLRDKDMTWCTWWVCVQEYSCGLDSTAYIASKTRVTIKATRVPFTPEIIPLFRSGRLFVLGLSACWIWSDTTRSRYLSSRQSSNAATRQSTQRNPFTLKSHCPSRWRSSPPRRISTRIVHGL